MIIVKLIHNKRNLLGVYLCNIAVYPSVEPGWLQATYEGRTGLIPENYVAFL